jgi:hypothetical protein
LPAAPPAPLSEQLSSLACTAPPVRRSLRPSHCHGLAHRHLVAFCLPSVPPLRSRLRMLCQLARAAASVNFLCTLRAEPKISAPLTYLQLNAQILHRFSKAASGPPSHLGLSPRCRGRLVVRWLLSRVRTGPSAARCRNAHRLIPCSGASVCAQIGSGLNSHFSRNLLPRRRRYTPATCFFVGRSSCYFVIAGVRCCR